MKNKHLILLNSTHIVLLLRVLAFILILITTYLLWINWQDNKTLIAALGILISALLASYSVILNVETTINIQNFEKSNRIRYIFFQLCLIKMKLILLSNESKREKINNLDFDRIAHVIYEIDTLLANIDNQNTISILHNKVLEDLYFLHLNINLLSTTFKSLINNIDRVNMDGMTESVLPNPLKTDLKIESSIELISKILLYIRKGYNKDFPGEGGIEECSTHNFARQ